jgi:hypothetical protein
MITSQEDISNNAITTKNEQHQPLKSMHEVSMRQTRLSIGCQDWQEITAKIGPAATGVLLYLRLTMRKIQAAEITISTAELAEALKLDAETVGNLLCMILDAELLDAVPGPDGLTTYQSKEEAAALADRFRKRATAARRQLAARIVPGLIQSAAAHADGNSGDILSDQNGISQKEQKQVYSEVVMVYDPVTGGKSEHAFFDQTGNSGETERKHHTAKKEKSLTESGGRASTSAPVREAELPADKLEAEYIDICGAWPPSLRKAVREADDDTREAFYLFIRQREQNEGKRWSSDRVRTAWLAARRIPAERRADSILAASMGGWKTIRDCGSGVYFDKSTGRVMSLVRGPVQAVNPQGGTASRAARDFARRFREE